MYRRMRPRMNSRHNFWGGPSGPPGFVPIVDPGEVWADESLQSIFSVRLTSEQLRVVQEAIGQEPIGRHGDYPNGSDYFWAFRTEEACKAAIERESAALSALRPRPAAPDLTNSPDRSLEEPDKKPADVEPKVPVPCSLIGYEYPELQNLSYDEMRELAEKLGVDYDDLLFKRLADGP